MSNVHTELHSLSLEIHCTLTSPLADLNACTVCVSVSEHDTLHCLDTEFKHHTHIYLLPCACLRSTLRGSFPTALTHS